MTTAQENPNKHFSSNGYLHIKTPARNLMFPLEGIDKTKAELQRRIDRLQAQIDTLNLYLEGKTVSDPDALR
jgi:hypothetical protein